MKTILLNQAEAQVAEFLPYYFLGFLVAVFLGGLIGFIFFTQVYKRRASVYLTLDDKELVSEIINLRTRIQTIYIFGPLTGLLLAFFGLTSYQELRDINDKAIQKMANGYLDSVYNQNYKDDIDLYREAKPTLDKLMKNGTGQLVFAKDLRSDDFSDWIDSRIVKYSNVNLMSSDYQTFGIMTKKYLDAEQYLTKEIIKALMDSRVSLQEFQQSQKNLRGEMAEQNSKYLTKARYEALLKTYEKERIDNVYRGNFSVLFDEQFNERAKTYVNTTTLNSRMLKVDEIQAKYDLQILDMNQRVKTLENRQLDTLIYQLVLNEPLVSRLKATLNE